MSCYNKNNEPITPSLTRAIKLIEEAIAKIDRSNSEWEYEYHDLWEAHGALTQYNGMCEISDAAKRVCDLNDEIFVDVKKNAVWTDETRLSEDLERKVRETVQEARDDKRLQYSEQAIADMEEQIRRHYRQAYERDGFVDEKSQVFYMGSWRKIL